MNSASLRLRPPRVTDTRVAAVLELLTKSADRSHVDFARLATSVNLSPSRLRHLFTQQMGISPMRYTKALRLQQAHQLLLGSFLTVKEVMGRCGFTDLSHFVRDYKQMVGETPAQTRLLRVATSANK